MRKTLGAALVGAALLTAVPASPASADCNVLLLVLTGQCHNACTLVGLAYGTVDATAFDVLPDRDFVCLA